MSRLPTCFLVKTRVDRSSASIVVPKTHQNIQFLQKRYEKKGLKSTPFQVDHHILQIYNLKERLKESLEEKDPTFPSYATRSARKILGGRLNSVANEHGLLKSSLCFEGEGSIVQDLEHHLECLVNLEKEVKDLEWNEFNAFIKESEYRRDREEHELLVPTLTLQEVLDLRDRTNDTCMDINNCRNILVELFNDIKCWFGDLEDAELYMSALHFMVDYERKKDWNYSNVMNLGLSDRALVQDEYILMKTFLYRIDAIVNSGFNLVSNVEPNEYLEDLD